MKRVDFPAGGAAAQAGGDLVVRFTEAQFSLARRIVQDAERYSLTCDERDEAAHLLRLIDDAVERRGFELVLDQGLADGLYKMLGRGYWQIELESRVAADAMMRLDAFLG